MDGAPDLKDRSLYERDILAWTREQVRALRARDLDAVDWENVIEEIDSLGRSQRSSLASALAIVLEHKIKLDHGLNREPERGWNITVATQQVEADRILEDNPSLRREVPDLLLREYRRARRKAMISFEQYEPERLKSYEASIPVDCPYSESDVLG